MLDSEWPLPLPIDGLAREQLAQEAKCFQVGPLITVQALSTAHLHRW